MKKAVCFIILLSVGCRRTEIITGTSYFIKNGIERRPVNILQKEEVVRLKGIYLAEHPLFRRPMILALIEGQAAYALIDRPLDFERGDYVDVEGKVVAVSGKGASAFLLAPENVARIASYTSLLHRAERDYLKLLRQMLQAKPADCPKKLPEEPHLLAVLDELRNTFIVFFSAADLLYSAEIDFVYDALKMRPDRIYINCYFKGE